MVASALAALVIVAQARLILTPSLMKVQFNNKREFNDIKW